MASSFFDACENEVRLRGCAGAGEHAVLTSKFGTLVNTHAQALIQRDTTEPFQRTTVAHTTQYTAPYGFIILDTEDCESQYL